MPKKASCIPTRMMIALLCASGVMELYISRTNLSIAIVAMVQEASTREMASTTSVKIPFCLRENSTTTTFASELLANDTLSEEIFDKNISLINEQEPNINSSPMKMTALERGNLLSAFFYSYGLSGIFGGRLAEIYGTKKIFGIAVFVDALANFLIPFAAKTSYGFLFFIRFTMGIFQGACYPSLHALAAKWIPPNEQPSFVSFVYPANSFGTIFSLTLCGILISQWGWESSFYVSGSFSVIWLLFWLFLVYDSPEHHPSISEEEKEFIITSQKLKIGTSKPKKVPFRKMLTSIPLWSINIAHAGTMIGLFFLLTQLPTYMSSIIGVNIRNNGFLSSLPFVARYFFGNIFGWISKHSLEKKYLKKATLKRILTILGFGGPAVALLFVGYVGCSTVAATTLFIIGMSFNSATLSGYCCNHLDLTTNFSGTAFGISSTVSSFYSMLGPVIVGALTPEQTLDEWKIVYWIVFINYVVSGTVYCFFLSTDKQPWDNDVTDEEKVEKLNSNEELSESLVMK